MRNLTSLLILILLTFISCDKFNQNDTIDYNPRVKEITYNTPPIMRLNYSNNRIISIELFIDDFLQSETMFYYSHERVDSSIYVSYVEEGRLDSIVAYYEYNNLNQLIRKSNRDVFSIGLRFEDYHYNLENKLTLIEKYTDQSSNAIIDSLIYDSDNKLKFYKEFNASYGSSGFQVFEQFEKYEVVECDKYANPFFHINKNLGIYHSTEFSYMTENNLIENTIQNDTPLTYNTNELKYDKHKRLISIDDKIFFNY